jgi:hypothetical protein
MTCGTCYHYRSGRCKNKSASTYREPFESDSYGCRMHLTRYLLPFGIIAHTTTFIITAIVMIISIFLNGGISPSNNSGRGGFEI